MMELGDMDETDGNGKCASVKVIYLGSQHEAGTGAEEGAMRCLLEERSSSDSSRCSSSSSEFWTDTGDALEATEDEMESIPAMAEFLSSSPAVWRRSLI